MSSPITYPANADTVMIMGWWWDHRTQRGRDELITALPIPAAGDPAPGTPNLVDIAARGRIKTGEWQAPPNIVTGFYCFPAVANNDPDLTAYGGMLLTFGKEPAFLIEVDVAAPIVEADQQMVDYVHELQPGWPIEVGDPVRAQWVEEAVNLSNPAPQPPVGYLNAPQVAALVVNEVDQHDADADAHPAIRALIEQGGTDATAALETHDADAAAHPAIRQELADGDTATATAAADDATAKVTAHTAAADPHGDRAHADAGLAALADVAHSGDAADLTGTLDDARVPTSIARDSDVATAVAGAIAELRDAAPEALNTFLEVAQYLADNDDALAALTNQIATKAAQTDLDAHTGDTTNPHAVTKAQVGLGNVANTAPADLPVSTAAQAVLDGKADDTDPRLTDTRAWTLYDDTTAPDGGQVPVWDEVAGRYQPGTVVGGGGLDTEATQDAAAALLTSGTHTGISYSYVDGSNRLDSTVAYGSSAGTAAAGNDTRLSDERTPADGTVTDAKVSGSAAIAEAKLDLAADAAAGTPSRRTLGGGAQQAAAGDHGHTPASLGAAAAAHTHPVADLSATGTAGDDTFLRGDGTWATPAGGGYTTRTVTVSTTAVAGEALWVDATGGDRAVTPPATPPAGAHCFVAKTDTSTNTVTWAGPVNDDPDGVELVSAGAGVTLLFDGTGWWIESTTTAATSSGGGGPVSASDITTGTLPDTVIPAGIARDTEIAAGYVPVTQRGPLGGVITLTDAATVSVNATAGTKFALAAAGDRTIALPTGGVDGQELTLRITATGAARTVTFASGYEIGGDILTRAVSIGSGATVYAKVEYRAAGTTWRLLAVG